MGVLTKLASWMGDPSQRPIRRNARVFVGRDGARVIVVTMHYNQDGVQYEDSRPVVLDSPSDTVLGESVYAALSATGRIGLDLRNLKRSDWPAYSASGARSIRGFEQEFIAIDISAANDANLVFQIEGSPEKDAELTVTAGVSSAAKPEAFGQLIRRVFAACRDRRV